MGTVSFVRLSDKTLARYLEAEKAGTLTKRQATALRSHRGLAGAVSMMRAEFTATREPRDITDWALVADPYSAPELKRLRIVGSCDGRPIKTNYVKDKVGERTYKTASGSLYRLVGDPEPGYVAFCKEHNITLDLVDPIKVRNSLDEFEWKGV